MILKNIKVCVIWGSDRGFVEESGLCVCVCVCARVCEREREREGGGGDELGNHSRYSNFHGWDGLGFNP